ncbi:YbjN domain-containing protein [Carboxylicivirga caseinilyticus]|uniref:YbjN domain-containing protein n=1 Tax=Carboxylicivirga caseinilyticus TaxID=3417572 RepID=UPI003D354BCC|nr:YbjN domain-containing protein [Marinilabiliaceae bacterium A049]
MSEHFNKVRDFLLDLEYRIVSEDAVEELFVVEKEEDGISNLIVDCEDSILIIEGLLFELGKGSEDIYKSLLVMNRQIVHGAFVLDEEGKKVIFRDTLQLENLDLNELEGSLNSLKLLLSEYSDQLIEFSKA